MKIIYRINGFSAADADQIARRVEQKKSKLVRVSGRLKGETVILRVNGRKSVKPEQAVVSLSLSLRKGVLFAERVEADPPSALDRALDALIEEIRTYRSVVSRERQRRRQGRIAEELVAAQPYLAEKAQREDREAFDARLRPLLRPIYALAVNEVRDRQMAEELPIGAIDPVEVLDEVVAQAYEAFRRNAIRQPLKTWLVAALHAYLDSVQKAQAIEPAIASSVVHLEQLVDHDDPMDVRSQGDDHLEFYQPDESLHFEDVLPDLALADPMETLSAREQMRFIHKTIRRLPRPERQSFLLHADGFDDLEIAMIQNRSENQVHADIGKVRELILSQLGLVR